jgi:hypothetical protein
VCVGLSSHADAPRVGFQQQRLRVEQSKAPMPTRERGGPAAGEAFACQALHGLTIGFPEAVGGIVSPPRPRQARAAERGTTTDARADGVGGN